MGIEASWRLLSWEALDSFSQRADHLSSQHRGWLGDTNSEDAFQMYIGKLLLSMKNMNDETFSSLLRQARLDVMSSLSTTIDSYDRAYPSLIRLHILGEIELGFDVMSGYYRSQVKATTSVSNRKRARQGHAVDFDLSVGLGGTDVPKGHESRHDLGSKLSSLNWDDRLNMLSPSTRTRSLVLAVRRSIFSIVGLGHLVANNWLDVSNMFRRSGKFSIAQTALRNAELCGLNKSKALLQECNMYSLC